MRYYNKHRVFEAKRSAEDRDVTNLDDLDLAYSHSQDILLACKRVSAFISEGSEPFSWRAEIYRCVRLLDIIVMAPFFREPFDLS